MPTHTAFHENGWLHCGARVHFQAAAVSLYRQDANAHDHLKI